MARLVCNLLDRVVLSPSRMLADPGTPGILHCRALVLLPSCS